MLVRQKSNEWPLVSYALNAVLVALIIAAALRHQPKDVTRLERYHAFMVHCTKLPGMDFKSCDDQYDEVILDIAGRK